LKDGKLAADGGRETLAPGAGVPFFLRPNQPFFTGSSSSRTTMRSSVKSGS
jgi:hypothetical protein